MTDSRTLPLALTVGAATLAWYALPDLVRSRPARIVLKGKLLAACGVAWALQDRPARTQQGPDTIDEVLSAVNDDPVRVLGLGTLGVGLATAATVWAEKAIFRYGERRRARGASFGHTLPALGLAVLGGLATLPLSGAERG